jgi:bifunctional non-homologous end joining protein LigD
MAIAERVARKPRKSPPTRPDSESSFPTFRKPQLATLSRSVPTGNGWLFEMKFDGYRCQASICGDQVKLFTRNGHDWSDRFAAIAPPLRTLTQGTLLIDGEICAIDAHGRSNFTLLKKSLDGKKPLVFFAFDLLEQHGVDIAPLPQLERMRRLAAIIGAQPANSALQYSHHVVGHGAETLAAMRACGFEGVIAKSATARYYGGDRSTAWLKVKCVQRQEFVVLGWRPPDYGPDDVRGLFLATYEDGRLVYRGGVGTGFTDRMRRDTLAVLQLIRTDKAPDVQGMPKAERRVTRWVEPRLLAEVAFTEITPDGLIRHPSFKGLREDKAAPEVRLEEAVP